MLNLLCQLSDFDNKIYDFDNKVLHYGQLNIAVNFFFVMTFAIISFWY